jgi:hypothetical protein
LNKRCPNQHSKNTFEKQLGCWIYNRQKNYIKKNINEIKLWEEFLNEYREYMKDNDTKWRGTLDQLKKFINENKRRPNQKSKNKEEQFLAIWISEHQSYYKKNAMKDPNRRQLLERFIEEYKEYMKDVDTKWYDTFDQLKKWIDQNNKRPIEKSKNQKEKTLAKWIMHQQQNYKKEIYAMKDYDKRKLWIEFIDQYKKYMKDGDTKWHDTFNQLKKWINDNKKRPNSHSKNTFENHLGHWISVQQKNYKNKKQAMKDYDKRQLWEIFIEEHKDYIKDLDTKWHDSFNQLKKFINDNKKKPNRTSKNEEEGILGKWITTQQQNYKNKRQSMKDLDKKQLWKELITKYPDLFDTSYLDLDNN